MKKYTIGLYEKAMPSSLTWKEKLKAAKEAGYDFVEISIDETEEKLGRLNWTKEERLELVRTMYEVGVPVRTMCLSGHRKYPLGSNDEQTVRRGMEIMERRLCSQMIWGSVSFSSPDMMSTMKKAVKRRGNVLQRISQKRCRWPPVLGS